MDKKTPMDSGMNTDVLVTNEGTKANNNADKIAIFSSRKI